MRLYTNSFVLAFTLLTVITYGQSKQKKNERDTTKQWEIGLDLLWLIDKNQIPATSIFARYNYLNKNGKYNAWRLRVGIDNNRYDSSQVSNLEPREINTFSLLLRPGLEFQRNISKNARFYYGFDTHLYTYRQKFHYVTSIAPDPSVWEGELRTFEFGFIPFIGLKYYPAKWCALSLESSLNIIYRIKRDKDQTGTVAFPGTGKGERNVDDFNINISPIAVLNFSFIINKKQHEK